jgi:hypothetical protein
MNDDDEGWGDDGDGGGGWDGVAGTYTLAASARMRGARCLSYLFRFFAVDQVEQKELSEKENVENLFNMAESEMNSAAALKQFSTFFEKADELMSKLRSGLSGKSEEKSSSSTTRADLADIFEFRRKAYRMSVVHAAKCGLGFDRLELHLRAH